MEIKIYIFKNDRVDHIEVCAMTQFIIWLWIISKEFLVDFTYSDVA